MLFNAKDRAFMRMITNNSTSEHIKVLAKLVEKNAPYPEMFYYGLKFLPRLRDPNSNMINLERLEGYKPEIVEFFDAISEIPSMPHELRAMATDLAIYANGESVQIDDYYQQLDPETALNKIFQGSSDQG